MDFNGLTNYSSYISSTANAQNQANTLKNNLNKTAQTSSSEELLDACKQFEAYLWEQVYKEMQKSVKLFEDGDENSYGSQMVDYFKDFALQEISASSTSDGANSLAMTLYEQMKRNYGITDQTDEQIQSET